MGKKYILALLHLLLLQGQPLGLLLKASKALLFITSVWHFCSIEDVDRAKSKVLLNNPGIIGLH